MAPQTPATRSISPRATSRRAGTTSSTTCRRRRRPCCTRAPDSRSGPEDLTPLFPMDLILQEVSGDQYVEIPGEVLDVYRLWRPSPLFRAHRLEKALGTPARIYYKYEGVSPAGSHKPNTAVPQAFYNAKAGIKKLTTETGAGPVGHRAGVRLRAVRPRVRGLAGAGVVRPEALPPHDDRDLRRHRAPEPERPDERRSHDPRPGPGQHRQPRHRDQRGGRGGGAGPDHQLRAGQRAQPRADAPDRDRRGGAAPAGPGRRDARPARRLHRRRLELRRARLPVPAREVGRADVADDPRGRARVVPVADAGHLRLRLRRHPRDDAADEDAHARPRLRARPDPRRRAALPRHEPADLAPVRDRRARGGRQEAVGVLRGRRALRAHRGHPARRPSRPTRSRRRSRRRWRARSPARRR